ncbi:hypothetical protein VNI00_009451 [Paramarasmius palmivorus]|uniref:Uncharacterized protein n=1 Tax=Paramarasmius palmivorus TaxID=297713 RepID=A0AAW0CPW6_9AGAR
MDIDDNSLADKIIPGRRAALKANTSFADQLGSSPIKTDDDEREIFGGSPMVKKGSSPVKYGSKKQKSGPPEDTQIPPLPFLCHFEPSASRSLSKNNSWSSSLSHYETLKDRQETWDVDKLGEYVWVLIDQSGRVFEPDLESQSEYCWWPAKKSRLHEGKITCIPYNYSKTKAEIHLAAPSASNILPIVNSLGQIRYSQPKFVSSDSLNGEVLQSPRKRRKVVIGIEKRWNKAVNDMMADREQDSDGDGELPTLEFSLSTRGLRPLARAPPKAGPSNPRQRKANGKSKITESISDSDDIPDNDDLRDNWSPPPPDELLRIPGEEILCRAMKSASTEYWIARVLSYIPPTNAREKGKYEVEFLDGIIKEVPRDWFYAYHEDGFGTCRAGQYASEFIDDPVSDGDDASRSPSPSPNSRNDTPSLDDPAPPATMFCDLSIREQFAYCKPVLLAVLNNRYPPARRRHDDFISGGKRRKGLNDEAGLRGKMDPKDVSRLQKLLDRWCLGDSGALAKNDDTHEEPDSGAAITELEGKVLPVPSDEGSSHEEGPMKATTNGATEDKFETTLVSVAADESKENMPPDVTVEGQSRAGKTPKLVSGTLPTTENTFEIHADPIPSSPPPSVPPSSSVASLIEVEPVSEPDRMPLVLDTSTPRISTQSIDDPFDSPLTELAASDEEDEVFVRQINITKNQFIGRSRERQRGCDAYEALSGIEKVDYTLQVLLPELVRQILLWRRGCRRSVAVMNDEEERKLHEKAEELVREVDWVWDVKRLRDMKVKELERIQRKTRSDQNNITGGTSTRPRRAGRG